MKIFYPPLVSLGFILILLIFTNELRAQITNIPSITQPSPSSGIYHPVPKDNIQPPAKVIPPVCVDSGSQGRRCGIMAVTFCKINPDAQNCQTINTDKKLEK